MRQGGLRGQVAISISYKVMIIKKEFRDMEKGTEEVTGSLYLPSRNKKICGGEGKGEISSMGIPGIVP